MARVIFAIIISGFVAFAAGASTFARSQACVQGCDDDGEDGQCAGDCTDCVCCPHLNVVAVFDAVSSGVERDLECAPEHAQPVLPLPEPHDILHVPITSPV